MSKFNLFHMFRLAQEARTKRVEAQLKRLRSEMNIEALAWIEGYKGKIEEKDKRIAELEEQAHFVAKNTTKLAVSRAILQQQLADAQKEIESLKDSLPWSTNRTRAKAAELLGPVMRYKTTDADYPEIGVVDYVNATQVVNQLIGDNETLHACITELEKERDALKAEVERLKYLQHKEPRIYTKCPACGNDTLTINDGHLLCTWYKCPAPGEIEKSEIIRSQLADAQKDSKRLDWLETQDRRICSDGVVRITVPDISTMLTLRAAIDAALARNEKEISAPSQQSTDQLPCQEGPSSLGTLPVFQPPLSETDESPDPSQWDEHPIG